LSTLFPYPTLFRSAVIRERTVCGERCSFGTFSTSDGDVKIGDRCRFHYYTFICKNTMIGKDVWMFPGSMLLEDKHPPCGMCAKGPIIKDRAAIGSAAVIMPGLTIGEDSVIAAATIVTRDVPAGMLVAGHPGKLVGKATSLRCGAGAVDKPYPWTRHYRRHG
jgi:acetyltransferase-like isoleucine patch superfamily enzyme